MSDPFHTKPRVLLIAHQYRPTHGPATLRLGAFVDAISAWADVTVLTSSSQSMATPMRGPAGELIIPVGVADATGQSVGRILRLLLFALAVLKKGWRLGKFQYVVFDPPPTAAAAALLLSRLRGGRAVYYFCDSWSQFAQRGGLAKKLHKVIAAIESSCLQRADLVVAAEEPLRQDALLRGAREVLLVLNGADVEIIRPIHGPDPAGTPRFIYAGTHSEVHRAGIFVEASEILWKEGSEFDVLFVGDGTDAADLDRYAQSEPRFSRRPSVPLSELGPLLDASVASLVSLGEVPPGYYQIPSKIYTSLAAGCPVLYCGSLGPMGFLSEKAASIQVSRDANAVADAMRAMISELGRREMHEERRRRARAYAVDCRDFRKNLSHLSDRMSSEMAPRDVRHET